MNKLKHLWSIMLLLFVSCSAGSEKPLLPDNYTSWNRTTMEELNYPIPGHENNYRKIFINKIGENPNIINNETGETSIVYPEGTVIIKEVYQGIETPDAEESPAALTAMVKASDDPRARGDWLWIMKTDSGERVVTTEFCINCHDVANEEHNYGPGNPNNEFRDYLFIPYTGETANITNNEE